ncbi:hypothetical protein I317_05668 [Kwoniella heveanensis CBS 569]|nr:hypothetical protein I317_05668 [Kwoniella heveanensis CBS 569]
MDRQASTIQSGQSTDGTHDLSGAGGSIAEQSTELRGSWRVAPSGDGRQSGGTTDAQYHLLNSVPSEPPRRRDDVMEYIAPQSSTQSQSNQSQESEVEQPISPLDNGEGQRGTNGWQTDYDVSPPDSSVGDQTPVGGSESITLSFA